MVDIQVILDRVAHNIATAEDKCIVECLRKHFTMAVSTTSAMDSNFTSWIKIIYLDNIPVYEIITSTSGEVRGNIYDKTNVTQNV